MAKHCCPSFPCPICHPDRPMTNPYPPPPTGDRMLELLRRLEDALALIATGAEKIDRALRPKDDASRKASR